MESLSLKQWLNKKGVLVFFVLFLLLPKTVFASTTGNLPFTSTMTVLEQAISGPFLLAAAVIMTVVTCLMLAFGEWGDGFKRIITIVLWLSIAFAATTFITTMFGGGAIC